MKKLTILSIILFSACANNALANVVYLCREAVDNQNNNYYSATFLPNGATLQVTFSSAQDKRGRASLTMDYHMYQFPVRVQGNKPGEQGVLGTLIRPLKDFTLQFYVMPNYKEETGQQEFMGGHLSLKNVDKFMLCDSSLKEIFN